MTEIGIPLLYHKSRLSFRLFRLDRTGRFHCPAVKKYFSLQDEEEMLISAFMIEKTTYQCFPIAV